jgi:excinuclease UvrABC nuclease subunit
MSFTDLIQATPQNLARIPERAGVYKLFQNGTLIYIGRSSGGSNTIKSRINSHYSGRSGPCKAKMTSYKYDTTVADVTTERKLLEEYKRNHGGKLPPCNDKMP